MIRYLDLADFLIRAEAATDIPAEKVAVLGHRIIANHPLPDGNKRTALLCMIEFVEINGCIWRPPSDDSDGDETVGKLVALASGDLSPDEFVRWVEERIADP